MKLSLLYRPAAPARVSPHRRSTLPGTLYPGVHWVTPLVERVELFSIRDRLFSTALADPPKKKAEILRVQTKEGLGVALAVTVRFKLDPSKLAYIYSNLPQSGRRGDCSAHRSKRLSAGGAQLHGA